MTDKRKHTIKMMICCLLSAWLICAAFSGCIFSVEPSPTASEALEELFTTVDLMDAAVSDLQKEMEDGHVTSEQLTQMYIDRINAYDVKLNLNSVIAINPSALDDARELDRERAEGEVRGPLHGVPIAVKANYDVAGMATSAGSKSLADMIAAEDSFAVKKLKDAGAVILAQTNMSEFAYSALTSRSTLGGNAHNPYDTSKTPGGSSGGTAVAVTCNFAAAGIGTDTGGSIRNPSSFCNLYGIRPSKGLTSVSGIIPLDSYRDTTGPMARTAEDTALLLEIMAGTDTADDYTVEAEADALLGEGYSDNLSADALKGMRIGYLEDSFSYTPSDNEDIDPAAANEKVQKMLDRTLETLRNAGVETVDLSSYLSTDEIRRMSKGIRKNTFEYDFNKYLSEKGDAAKYKTLKELYTSGTEGVDYLNLDRIIKNPDELADSFEETENPYPKAFSSYQRIANWQKVLDGRAMLSKIMQEHEIDAVMYLNNFDVSEDETNVVNENQHNPAKYDLIFGPLFGLPEISLPMGFSDPDSGSGAELPLGISIFSDFGQEMTLLNIAYAYEQQAGDTDRRTPALTPALEDKALSAFLADLIEKAEALDVVNRPREKVQIMTDACKRARAVDTKDPYATYGAAKALAEAYDALTVD